METMEDNSVDFILSDIPYGECSGFVEGGLRKVNRDLADKDADGTEFDAARYARECLRICKGNIIIFCGHKQIGLIRAEMEKAKAQMIRLLIWEKPNVSPMNGQYFFLNSIEQAICCRQQGAYFAGKCEHCVIEHPTQPTPIHPTSKPIPLLKQLIEWCCPPDGIVFDGTAGSCTTAVAAHECGRKYICVEKNKDLYDKALEYWKPRLTQGVMF